MSAVGHLKSIRLAYLYSHKGMTSLIRFTALVSLSRTLISVI